MMAFSDTTPPNNESGDPFGRYIAEGMNKLGVGRGDKRLCIITDASFVRYKGRTTERYVDVIGDVTGNSVGRGNLLLVHRPARYRLFAALYNKATRACVLIAADSTVAIHGPVTLAVEHLDEAEEWQAIKSALGASDAFSLVAIASHWAAGAPYDFLKCAELHDHLCPGIASGYFIARYIQKLHPLGNGESYTFISCPSWCKDDGILMILGLTPGKHGMYAKSLTREQLSRVADPNVAGILLVNHGSDIGATARILAFDQAAVINAAGTADMTGLRRIVTTLTGIIPFCETPERFVKVLKTMDIDTVIVDRLKQTGDNPYETLGFVQ